jgi:hypothetical protein
VNSQGKLPEDIQAKRKTFHVNNHFNSNHRKLYTHKQKSLPNGSISQFLQPPNEDVTGGRPNNPFHQDSNGNNKSMEASNKNTQANPV